MSLKCNVCLSFVIKMRKMTKLRQKLQSSHYDIIRALRYSIALFSLIIGYITRVNSAFPARWLASLFGRETEVLSVNKNKWQQKLVKQFFYDKVCLPLQPLYLLQRLRARYSNNKIANARRASTEEELQPQILGTPAAKYQKI